MANIVIGERSFSDLVFFEDVALLKAGDEIVIPCHSHEAVERIASRIYNLMETQVGGKYSHHITHKGNIHAHSYALRRDA